MTCAVSKRLSTPPPVTANKTKSRLDTLLVERGDVESRNKAQGLILAGSVRVDGKVVTAAGTLIGAEATIEIVGRSPYVGRGGEKLAAALTHFQIDVTGKQALDSGLSTGGFTDCLLQRGAVQVFGVDVAYGQVDWRIRQDPRVILIERTNLRHLFDAEEYASWAQRLDSAVDLVTLDLSFISIVKVLPTVLRVLRPGGELLALVKPQFELERGEIGKGGIVRDEALRLKAVEKVASACAAAGLTVLGSVASAVRGTKGNQEYFLHCRRVF